MRLARQAAHLGFSPDSECLLGAKQNAYLIKDISPERIFTELQSILRAEERYGNKDGAYQGLRLLEEIGVFAYIFPELQLGKNMTQRKDFHDYDVLEHSLRAVKYADSSIRLAALLHDIGKPFCQNRDGNVHEHHKEGAILAKQVLTRLKAPNHLIKRIPALIEWHMYDMDCKTSEHKLRRFFVEHAPLLEKLLLIKQADYSACKDDLSPCPTSVKWKAVFSKMQAENAPFFLKDLAVKGNELAEWGIPKKEISKYLKKLLLYAVNSPQDNEKKRLQKICLAFYKEDLKKELSQRDD
jgi:tRNA nucleotidyltransferase/poly(A) polymerase